MREIGLSQQVNRVVFDFRLLRPVAGAFAALLCAAPALAKTYCVFETECFEAEVCTPSTLRFDFDKGGGAGAARISSVVQATTEFGDLGGFFIKQDGDTDTIAFEGAGAFYFLTVTGRDARLSVHMEGPMVVTYLGTCEALG